MVRADLGAVTSDLRSRVGLYVCARAPPGRAPKAKAQTLLICRAFWGRGWGGAWVPLPLTFLRRSSPGASSFLPHASTLLMAPSHAR
jgi:hypothetical protein